MYRGAVRVPQVALAQGVSGLSAGSNVVCAVHDERLKCWGSNTWGKLGFKPKGDEPQAISTPTPLPFRSLEGVSLGDDFMCAVVKEEVRCWGYNKYGQLGAPRSIAHTHQPQRVAL